MQAIQIFQHGDPSVLQVVDIPRPVPKPGDVLARVLGVSLNHLDLWTRRGMPGFVVEFPRILGCDATGEIVALGDGVEGLSVGDKVLLEPGYSSGESAHDRAGNDHLSDDYGIRGEHGDGYCCEYVALPARYVLRLPTGLDPVRTAATPLVFLTAWGMLVTKAKLQSGETCLVIGGASGVGSAAIQIARSTGARVVATAGSASKLELARQLGADAVIDHSKPDWAKELKKLSGGRGFDVVVEHVGPATWDVSMRSLARNGRLVTCGGTTGPTVQIQLPHLFIKNQSVLGSTMGPKSAFPTILNRLARGDWQPVIDRVLPLSKAREAHELLESRAVHGKIVLVPGA
ncbi:MAG: zinc-binding dehydrogenase [Planctomycetes bacterium]|nr:zinc-binding dehydrogenase [Planctomycetota bacterium]